VLDLVTWGRSWRIVEVGCESRWRHISQPLRTLVYSSVDYKTGSQSNSSTVLRCSALLAPVVDLRSRRERRPDVSLTGVRLILLDPSPIFVWLPVLLWFGVGPIHPYRMRHHTNLQMYCTPSFHSVVSSHRSFVLSQSLQCT
jgi:hypothetical protein